MAKLSHSIFSVKLRYCVIACFPDLLGGVHLGDCGVVFVKR